jgi:hypothetical protein
MIEKKESHRWLLLIKERLNAPRQCLAPDCARVAIKSHVLQKRGVLSEIATDGYVMERRSSDFFLGRRLERTSVNNTDILAFKGFCDRCDKKIFQEIEDFPVDFRNYRHLLLFAYRGHLCAMHRSRAYSEVAQMVSSDESFSSGLRDIERGRLLMYTLREITNEQYKLGLEDCLFNSSKKNIFTFTQFTMPRVDIVASTSFSKSKVIDSGVLKSLANSSYSELVKYVDPGISFINLLPVKNNLVFSFGYNSNSTINGNLIPDAMRVMDIECLYKFISDILIIYTEIWAISIPFFKIMKSNGQYDELLKLLNLYSDAPYNSVSLSTDFNLFKGLY